jgi:hypothetical protein
LTVPHLPGSVRSVRLRLLPWKPRWRSSKKDRDWDFDVPDLGDDPVSLVIGILVAVVLLPGVLFLVIGLLLFSAEIALLLALVPLLMIGQVVGVLPWQLAVSTTDGAKHYVEARGPRQLRTAWRHYRSLR